MYCLDLKFVALLPFGFVDCSGSRQGPSWTRFSAHEAASPAWKQLEIFVVAGFLNFFGTSTA